VSYQPPSPGFHVPYPAAGAAPGAPPPPRRRLGLNAAIVACGLVVVLGIGTASWWYLDRINSENPRVALPPGAELNPAPSATPGTAATPRYAITFPDQVDDLPMVTDPRLTATADETLREVQRARGLKTVDTHTYLAPRDASHFIILFAGTGAFDHPRDFVTSFFTRPGGRSPAPTVPLGDSPTGATLECGTDTAGDLRSGDCIWADHGGFLMLLDVGRGATASANLVRSIVPQVLRPA
jgi:hypothetical protein